ncbi:MAG TPA: M20/M25/M40 family metallo-hydrolase [Candidatus Saccharimonadales bacterium]|nr:M20/M25/M40 family metallo-hydrolase [Candidatus Saccharimonadales bacterium]
MSALDTYKQLLAEFVAFPSISTDSAYSSEITKTAGWLVKLLEGHGFAAETWSAPGINPVVYGRYEVSDPKAATILVYGHYDVQPADEADGWQSAPFSLAERHNRLFGRGVVDNKGQILVHIATVAELIKSKQLAHNIIFLIEGNEETGSTGLSKLLQDHHEQLISDHILISDGEIPYRPTIEASLRGGFNLRIHYRTAKTNLHSGIYGGGIPNAAQELSQLLGSLYDSHKRLTVPGFYDDVDAITSKQTAATEQLFVGKDRLQEITGAQSTLHHRDYPYGIATSLLPSLEVSGVQSGYTGAGFANIIPAEAEARLNVRIVASQRTHKVYSLLEDYIHKQTPAYVDCEVEMDMACEPIKLVIDSPIVTHTRKLLHQAYGKQPLFAYSGGSIPIVSDFKALFGKDCLLVNLGNDDCNMHGIDENFEIGLLEKGLAFSQLFFSQPIQ